MKSPIQLRSNHKFKKKSQLGKRLLKQSKPRKQGKSTNDFKNYMKEPHTSEEISTSSRNQNLRKNFEELSRQVKKNSERFYLGKPRMVERNEDTKFKILNAKSSIKRKSKVDGSRLTDNGREIGKTQEIETQTSDANKTSPKNFMKSRNKKKINGKILNSFKKANRSLDSRYKKKITLKSQILEQEGFNQENRICIIQEKGNKKKFNEQNKSLDKAKFYLPRNLKVFKTNKRSLMNFEKHKLIRQKTLQVRPDLKRVQFLNKKKIKMNGSQDSFKTHDYIHKRFKPLKGPKQKNGLMVIKKKIESKNSLLKARSFDKSRIIKDNAIGAFTFGK